MNKKWMLPLVVLLAVCGNMMASEVVTEVIRMQKSGVDEPVLSAYVQKAGTFSLSADEIVELETAGVPSSVIVVMLDKDGASTVAAPEADVVATTDTTTDVAYFSDALAPYGTWTDDREYGRVFIPAEAVSDANWQPYVDNGTWVYTDQGWFWNSSYAWGWAPFHYGRWAHRDRWVWIPDNVWGPSWVSWRHNDNYYGWAPLTPRARFEAGVGFRFGSGNIDVSLGLGERDYFFVPSHSFLEVNLRSSGVRNEERGRIYGQTTVVNNYTVNNTTVVNQGIPVANVSAATKREVKPVAIAAHEGKPGEKATASRVQGDKVEVFRPALQAKAGASVADRRATAKTETPRATVNAAAKTDTRKAELAQRVRERAKTETPKQQAKTTERAETPREPKTPERTPEVKNDPAVKPPQERNANAAAEHARIEEARKTREEREPKKNIEPETRNPVPNVREPQTRQPERQPEPKAERRPEPKVETRPEVRPESRIEPRAEPKAEPREERRPEPRAAEERRPQAQPQVREERNAPEPKEKRDAK